MRHEPGSKPIDDVERDLKRLLAITNATLAVVRRLAERVELEIDAELARWLEQTES